MIKAKHFPQNVSPVPGEIARYRVRSSSRNREHLVDINEIKCACERDNKGIGAQRRKELGYLPYADWCDHLKQAACYHALLCCMARQEQELKR